MARKTLNLAADSMMRQMDRQVSRAAAEKHWPNVNRYDSIRRSIETSWRGLKTLKGDVSEALRMTS